MGDPYKDVLWREVLMATSKNITSSSTIPEKLKENIKFLLSNHPKGILAQDFCRVYNKVFNPEQLQFRKYGFSHFSEFAKALQDAMSVHYSPKENNLKVFKAGTPYKVDESQYKITPDRRGLYSLRYPKMMEKPESVIQDVVDRFAPAGKVVQVDSTERTIFIRFAHKREVIKALEQFSADVWLTLCVNSIENEKIIEGTPETDGNISSSQIVVHVGNLSHKLVKSDLETYLQQFSPDNIILKKRFDKNDKTKVVYSFAYVDFDNSKAKEAMAMINQINRKFWKGRQIRCHIIQDKEKGKEKPKEEEKEKQRVENVLKNEEDLSNAPEVGLSSEEKTAKVDIPGKLWWHK